MSSKEERLVLDNKGLVYYCVKGLGLTQNDPNYDDVVSVGKIGLIKASRTFNEQKKIKFSTYAVTCITNEIGMYYRITKKFKHEVSMEEPIAKDIDGNELLLENVVANEHVNVAQEVQNREEAERILKIMLNYLEEKERLALLYGMGDINQKKVADLLKVSQSYISRLERKAIKNVKEAIKFNFRYDEVFFVEIGDYFWKVEFECKDTTLATHLQNITPIEGLSGEVIYQDQRIIVKIPADEIFLAFVGQIIQEMESYTTDN